MKHGLIGLAAFAALASCNPQAPESTRVLAPSAIGVDGAAIINADATPDVWLSHGRTYSEQRFSPLESVTGANVGELGLAWMSELDTARGMEATPIVVDGVMYVTSAWSVVYALDAKTGERKWKYDPGVDKSRGGMACCDVVNRGVALWKGKVYVGTIDGRLVALDAATGEVAWETVTVDQSKPYTITGAPRVVKGKVLIGNGGAELGVRGYITAYDAETGEQAWRFYFAPNPDKQPDGAASDKVFAETANATWDDAGAWRTDGGGGTAWDAMAYDPDLDILYVGTGNGSPWNRTIRSPSGGDNLFLSSIVALKPDTGDYVWHYQTTPGETWDYTATQHIILADLTIGDQVRKVAMQAPKNGFFYVLDRATGELLSADMFQPVNWATGVDLTTGRPIETPEARFLETPFAAVPGPLGSHNWHPMAFSPQTGLVYIPAQVIPQIYVAEQPGATPQALWNTGVEFAQAGPTPTLNERQALRAALKGQLVAWDPVAKKPRWVVDYPTPWNGGVLATAGGLVFQGGLDGRFRAYDAATGEKRWEVETKYPTLSGPISYEIAGEQYIAVTAGWGTAFPLTAGGDALETVGSPELGRVLVFKVGGTAELPEFETFEADLIPPAARFGTEDQLALGRTLYDRNCMVCHGPLVVSSGVVQDLRWAQAPATKATFAEVVLGGKYASAGMPAFTNGLTADEVEMIRAYVVMRANEDAPAPAPQ
ncbi:PQQ-dependent dehydrogenase, methanol/ethanol family [bacterium]|nr:PQQ-dependent dehydrogenase, methanol/ethanol family [bacterium]